MFLAAFRLKHSCICGVNSERKDVEICRGAVGVNRSHRLQKPSLERTVLNWRSLSEHMLEFYLIMQLNKGSIDNTNEIFASL